MQSSDGKAKKVAVDVALFGAGCFWGVEEIFAKAPGVVETEVGYAGGTLEHATYEQVKTGRTGHTEVIRIEFDPAETKYEALVELFFRMHDPTTLNRQGPDVGMQYRSVIFFQTQRQREIAQTVMVRMAASGRFDRPIVTEIVPAAPFWRAEEYHQQYLQKNGGHSCHYIRD